MADVARQMRHARRGAGAPLVAAVAALGLVAVGCPKGQSPASALGLDPVTPMVRTMEAERRSTATVRQPRPTPEWATNGPVNHLAVVVHGQPFVLSLPTGGAETISRCEAGDYVPVVQAKDGYAGVRMADGKVGWVLASALELLDEPAIPVARPDDSKGRTIVIRAMSYLGVPYVWGGTTASGLDCSGFVQRVFGEGGIDLPRVACDQAQVGTPIGLGALEPGDRIYFQAGHEIDHTGIYIGNGRFIHASGSGGAVRVDDLMGARWQRIYAGARRSNL